MSYPEPHYLGDRGECSATFRPVNQSIDVTIGHDTAMQYLATGASTRERDKENPIGEGLFCCRVPRGRTYVINRVENRQSKPLEFAVGVNGQPDDAVTIPPRQTINVRTPIPERATDLTIRYRAAKQLVVLETAFE